jgi:hypothetical protein
LCEAFEVCAAYFRFGGEVPLQEKSELIEGLFALVGVFDELQYLCFALFRELFFELEILVKFSICS